MSSQSEKIKPKTQKQAEQNSFPHQPNHQPMSKSAPLIRRELQQIIPNLNREQRQGIADQLIKQLREQGIEEQTLAETVSIQTTDPRRMNAKDISHVATYTYEHYPEIFEAVLTQPNVVQFLSPPVLSAIVGIMAAKWLNP
ncbi:MAG: hypothetical protein GVY04_22505 [Cyanobacteria bacterium]|jgi:DNA-directed RNA polymerase specialized sigma54-like protein|nr:hypothetical protein [Cyanobacteria bacterium GSL.Bin1]